MNKFYEWLCVLRRWAWRLEDGLLLLWLLSMIVLACLQIFMRNAFDAGWLWVDPLLRVLFLWTALFGAMIASRYDKHISIDVFSKWLPPRLQLTAKIISVLFAAVICALAAFYAACFVLDEYRYSTAHIAGLRIWMFQLVMPLAFAVMALRFATQSAHVICTRQGRSL